MRQQFTYQIMKFPLAETGKVREMQAAAGFRLHSITAMGERGSFAVATFESMTMIEDEVKTPVDEVNEQ